MNKVSCNTFSLEEFEALKIRLQKDSLLKVKIISGSMEPLVMTNSFVEVFPVRKDHEYLPFRLYIYRDLKGKLICHYFWKRSTVDTNNLLFRCLKGGNIDYPVKENEVLGVILGKKVNFHHVLFGRILSFLFK